jgi:Zn-dependent protease with chaperone function
MQRKAREGWANSKQKELRLESAVARLSNKAMVEPPFLWIVTRKDAGIYSEVDSHLICRSKILGNDIVLLTRNAISHYESYQLEAGVAHEIGHIALGHPSLNIQAGMGGMALAKIAPSSLFRLIRLRKNELAADRLAVVLCDGGRGLADMLTEVCKKSIASLSKESGSIGLFKRLAFWKMNGGDVFSPGGALKKSAAGVAHFFLSDHPSYSKRISNIEKTGKSLAKPL